MSYDYFASADFVSMPVIAAVDSRVAAG